MQHEVNLVDRFSNIHHHGVNGQVCESAEAEQIADEPRELLLHPIQQVVLGHAWVSECSVKVRVDG